MSAPGVVLLALALLLVPPAVAAADAPGNTPRARRSGRYAIVVHADASARGNQRYHLQLARATADDTAPGVFVPNYARVRDSLDGRGVDQVDLYRFDVTRRSVLFLHLRTAGAFDLVLLDAWGDVIRCECDGRGGQSLHKGLHPGRFFVAIRSRDRSSARYTLLRASRSPPAACAPTARAAPRWRRAWRRRSPC
jgi:hypothetical protein